MIPRALIKLQAATEPVAEPDFEFSWYDYHPGDHVLQFITTHLQNHLKDSLSDIIITNGFVIYLRWEGSEGYGICAIMAAIIDDFYQIGLDAYNWSRFCSAYADSNLTSWDDLVSLYENDFHDPEIAEIPKTINREWFEVAIEGGTFELDRSSSRYHVKVANIFGFFPWIIYFATDGKLTSSSFIFNISIIIETELDKEAIFNHIKGDMDEQFWLLVYQFVEQLDTIPDETQSHTLYRYLQAVHDLTSTTPSYELKVSYMFEYRDLLSIIDPEYLRDYVHQVLMEIGNENSSVELCELLLQLSSLLLDLEFTELGKLSEATTLEHALNLDDSSKKREIIIELTHRSSTWGENHLISFIQSLTGLLTSTDEEKTILSDAINEISDQLKQSWDGMLCIVDGKLISDNVGDALSLRFEATQLLHDKFTRAEDIFSALIWSLQYDWSATNRYQLVLSYLDSAFDILPSDIIIDQSDVVIQSTVKHEQYEFLRYYLQYIRTQLDKIKTEHHDEFMDKIEEVLPSPRNYPLIHIEYLIIRLFSLQFITEAERQDKEFELVSQIFNTINPTLAESVTSLEYITARVIEFGTIIGDWDVVEEGKRRFLLMSQNQDRAHKHLQTIFFKFALDRAKLTKDEVNQQDIGLQLFNEGMEVSDIAEDSDLIMQILPHIKKLAIKSRSYNALTNLVITEIKLKKLYNQEWIPQLLQDINTILKRGKTLDVTMIFSEAFSNLDLTIDERQKLIQEQLQLTEVEPDLLTADEIYDKRLELIQLNPEASEDQEFIIDNYQQGISELISKGDTENLTNLLLEAIEFSKAHDATEIVEFKGLLLDNFQNIIQDYRSTQSPQLYQYLLTVWRRLIDLLMESDLSSILNFASKLIQLNINIFQSSSNSKYLRRAQLVMKEFSLIADRSPQTLSEIATSTVLADHNQITDLMINQEPDFGIFNAIFHSAEVLYRFDLIDHLYPLLDQGISQIKHEIMVDHSAQSSIFYLLLILAEVAIFIEADLNPESLEQINSKADRLISFALSLDLSTSTKENLKELQQNIAQDPFSLIHEYPFSLNQYLDGTVQYRR